MKTTRAWSVLDVRSVNEGARTITGIATTPSTDRMGDVVEPLGVEFKNPMPLLWQHQHDKPVGTVRFDKPTEKGIGFVAELASVDEPGPLKDRIDEAWQSLKARLVRGVSIGFRALEYSFIEGGGIRFAKTEVLELSLVTIPANADATITSIKRFDSAASGHTVVRINPGASGTKTAAKAATKPNFPRNQEMKTYAEQIADFEAALKSKQSQMDEIMSKSAETGETLDAEQSEQYDTLEAEVAAIDKHLVRLRKAERTQAESAKSVESAAREEGARPAESRVITVKADLPKGTRFARYAMALAAGRGSISDALKYAERWRDSTPEVEAFIKGTAGTTADSDWAKPLVDPSNLVGEFIELLRPATILGKMDGFRNVPFNVKIPVQIGGSTVEWVGEGAAKPVSDLSFDTVTLGFNKVAGIVVLTDELVRFSSPSAEQAVRQDLVAQIAQFLDDSFINPAHTATGSRPGSVTNLPTPISASGVYADSMIYDIQSMIESFLTANLSPAGAYLVMSSVQAARIALFRNALGQYEFPNMGADGGSMLGFRVVTSESVPTATNGESIIALVKPSEILMADDGSVTLDASREATLDLAGGDTPNFSLWQKNCVGLRAERFITWKARRAAAVAYISGANYQSLPISSGT